MPIYEFECKCKDCNHIFEEQISINNKTEIQCPKCNGETKKLISKSTFKINGFNAMNGYSWANK